MKCWVFEMPALLKSTSSRPNSPAASSSALLTLVRSPTSQAMPTALPPAPRIDSAVASAPAPFRSATTTPAPSAPSRRATPLPIPRAAPVTTMLLPSSFPICPSLSVADKAIFGTKRH